MHSLLFPGSPRTSSMPSLSSQIFFDALSAINTASRGSWSRLASDCTGSIPASASRLPFFFLFSFPGGPGRSRPASTGSPSQSSLCLPRHSWNYLRLCHNTLITSCIVPSVFQMPHALRTCLYVFRAAWWLGNCHHIGLLSLSLLFCFYLWKSYYIGW